MQNFGLVDALRRKYLKSFMIVVYLSEETRQKYVAMRLIRL